MHKSVLVRLIALTVAPILLSIPVAPSWAGVTVPVDTQVPLKLVNTLDSQHLTEGTEVDFTVAADTILDRQVVIRGGTPVTGTVTKVSKPGVYGTSSQVIIGFLTVTAVDNKPIQLQNLKINAASLTKNIAIAAGTSIGAALLLGPIGLVSGVFIHGGWVQVPAGSVITGVTESSANVALE